LDLVAGFTRRTGVPGLLIGCWAALITLASPAGAQEPACPATPSEWRHQCRSAAMDVTRLDREIADLASVMNDPNVLLVNADRLPGESAQELMTRIGRASGLRSPVTRTWLPIRGRYYLADQDRVVVAIGRRDYWRYLGEVFGLNSAEAKSIFSTQERMGLDIRLTRFLGPNGRIGQMRAELRRREDFIDRCCGSPPMLNGTPPRVSTP
jgi:hypothetical protein